LTQLEVPEATSDGRSRLIVAIFECVDCERRRRVEDVVHPERNLRVIQPGSPATRIVLGSADRQDIFVFAVLSFHVLAAVLRVSGYGSLWRRGSQIKRVGTQPVERNPLADVAIVVLGHKRAFRSMVPAVWTATRTPGVTILSGEVHR